MEKPKNLRKIGLKFEKNRKNLKKTNTGGNFGNLEENFMKIDENYGKISKLKKI